MRATAAASEERMGDGRGCFNASSYDRTAWFGPTEKGEALLDDCEARRFEQQLADGRWTEK